MTDVAPPAAGSATASAAAAAPPPPGERDGPGDSANSMQPSMTRLLHLLAELREYQVSSAQEQSEVEFEQAEQNGRLIRLEQQLLAEEQISLDLERRVQTLEDAIRQERRLSEKLSQDGAQSSHRSLRELLHPEILRQSQTKALFLSWQWGRPGQRHRRGDDAGGSGDVRGGTQVVLFICETNAFLRSERRTDVSLDSNQDSMLTINFDVTMLDMACDHVTVGVWDAFGSDRMNITKNIQKQRIDHKGAEKGHAYTDDELLELDYSDKTLTAEDKAELDSDWSSSSDQFKHDSFESVPSLSAVFELGSVLARKNHERYSHAEEA
ncbi:PDIL5-4 [Symbiodinium natans]|uniref:PDIL5-4 protein n=1 Tax=Symbiodinium natans TaxID=878477 RepID=A0A812UY61_9DINO|nr:PDIL5-4 [Symbiodinium natans]